MSYKRKASQMQFDRGKPKKVVEMPNPRMRGTELVETRWKEDNAGAIESSNAYVEKHGLPLTQHRVKL